ncbi:MAG: hypothetical protein IIZ13_00870 [Renibacterium sp.]|nr:hypothetical protein [Renibacterium sp.]
MSTTPEPRNEPSEDEVWADLVSRLKEDSDSTLLGHAETPDGPVGPAAASEPSGPPGAGFSRFDPLNVSKADDSPPPRPVSGAMAGPRDYSPPEDDSDAEFVPAEPASLATVEPAIALGWVGAVGAPIALLLAAMFWRGLPWFAIVGLVLAFIGSAGYLIYRMPGHRDHDDDGAQV